MGNVTITIKGQPVDEVIKEQVAAEIAEVRESENRIKFRQPVITKRNGNHSGEKTGPGVTLYLGDPKTTDVLIYGSFWPIGEKRPFELSGLSCWGAVEFCKWTKEFKCHECAEWVLGLGQHVRMHHKQFSSFGDYKIKHGLPLKRGVQSPEAKMRQVVRARVNLKHCAVKFSSPTERSYPDSVVQKRDRNQAEIALRSNYVERGKVRSPGQSNVFGLCRAQMIRDMKQLCESLGRTPTGPEMQRYKNSCGYHSLTAWRIQRLFPSRSGFFACVGVSPRKTGLQVNRDLNRRICSDLRKAEWTNGCNALQKRQTLRAVGLLKDETPQAQ